MIIYEVFYADDSGSMINKIVIVESERQLLQYMVEKGIEKYEKRKISTFLFSSSPIYLVNRSVRSVNLYYAVFSSLVIGSLIGLLYYFAFSSLLIGFLIGVYITIHFFRGLTNDNF